MLRIQEEARTRYDSQIMKQEKIRDKMESEIAKLESRERELIKRLKNTQQTHQQTMKDLDRIINDEDPSSIILSQDYNEQ